MKPVQYVYVITNQQGEVLHVNYGFYMGGFASVLTTATLVAEQFEGGQVESISRVR